MAAFIKYWARLKTLSCAWQNTPGIGMKSGPRPWRLNRPHLFRNILQYLQLELAPRLRELPTRTSLILFSDTNMKKQALKFILIPIAAALLFFGIIKLTGEDYYQNKEYTWYAATGAKDNNLLIRGAKIDKIKNNINKLIYALNKSDKGPETFRTPGNKEPTDPPKLKLKGIKENVVNVEVINDEYLTQRMGSTGADEFLAVATFTLTEYDHIKSVRFIFKEGDHAVPGLYSRENFLKNWKATQ
jgi:hypothetical protein